MPHFVDEVELRNDNVNGNEREEFIEAEINLNDPDVPQAARDADALLQQGWAVRQEIMQQLEEERLRRIR